MPTRRELLLGAAGSAGVLGLARWVQAAEPTKNLILVMADGGWDPTFTFDPKPGVAGVDGPYFDLDPDNPRDVEEIGTWGEIDVSLNRFRRPRVTEFFESYGHYVTAVRGLWVGSVAHPVCRRRVLTGSDERGRPDVPTIVGSELGGDRAVGVFDMAGTGWFGDLSHLAVRKGPNGQLRDLVYPPSRDKLVDGTNRPLWLPEQGEQALIEQWIADRTADDTAVRPWRAGHHQGRIEARHRAQQLEALGPDLEPLLAGADTFSGQVPLVVELLASGACSTIVMDTGETWDNHFDAYRQHENFDTTFDGLGKLVKQLSEAGLIEDTLIVALSEMGRTPYRNPNLGTDHWPYTSALIMGSGVAGGRVVGGTDDGCLGLGCDLETGRVVPGGQLLSYESFAAGILEHMGVDYERWLPGVQPLRAFRA